MKTVPTVVLTGAVLALVGAGAALTVLQQAGYAPRVLARYMERRADKHNPAIVKAGGMAANVALGADRGDGTAAPAFGLSAGAQPQAAPAEPAALREVMVGSVTELRLAVDQAMPGDAIILFPGRYLITGTVGLLRSGTAAHPIVLMANAPGSVQLEIATVQGFVINGAHWRVENLSMRGVCTQHADCEHAFHVGGGGTYFTALNNTLSDFNAHFKINGEDGRFPDHGRIEGNTLENSAPRSVDSTVAAIDMVAVNDWVVRRNLIRDFLKAGGDQVSFGAYAKGAGARNLFEQNVVLCESALQAMSGARVGLSLGGGGTGPQFCRDGRCIMEQEDSTLRANLVAGCSDAGIYLNSASRSLVVNNTLLDTAGIDVRFAASTARVDGNLVDGAIRSRNDGVLYLGENMSTSTAALFLGWHPVRRLFAEASTLRLDWAGEAPRRTDTAIDTGADLCGAARPAQAALGAFENFAACRQPGPLAR
ncbi:MAG: chondroitinase-B domain-containing protein [Massilia sp.]